MAILIVDDEPDLLLYLSRLLQPAGYQVIEAGDGQAALRLLAASAGDLVITDIYMPNQDGLAVVIECKKRKIPVIAMSGGAELVQIDELRVAEKLGASHVLEKPFDGEQLLQAVAKALGKK